MAALQADAFEPAFDLMPHFVARMAADEGQGAGGEEVATLHEGFGQ